MEGLGVYNRTAPFQTKFNGKNVEVILARVETHDRKESEANFFEKLGNWWRPPAGAPTFKMQDPFVTSFGKKI